MPSNNENVVFGRGARRKNPAERVRVNSAGTISVLSITRALGLADNAEFSVRLNRRQKSITLTPLGDFVENEAEPDVGETPETQPDTDG